MSITERCHAAECLREFRLAMRRVEDFPSDEDASSGITGRLPLNYTAGPVEDYRLPRLQSLQAPSGPP